MLAPLSSRDLRSILADFRQEDNKSDELSTFRAIEIKKSSVERYFGPLFKCFFY
jgi:hypothetical protein